MSDQELSRFLAEGAEHAEQHKDAPIKPGTKIYRGSTLVYEYAGDIDPDTEPVFDLHGNRLTSEHFERLADWAEQVGPPIARLLSKADARLAPDGWQYGVMFTDNSVAARWNGRTQRQRAEEYLAELRRQDLRDGPQYRLVRRQPPHWVWREA